MSSSYHQWFSIAMMILHGFAMAAALVIVWIGWLRTRRFAYLVLGAWAIVSMLGLAVQSMVLPSVQGRFAELNSVSFMLGFQLLRSIVTSVLLLAGLGMLVFGPRQAGASSER
jgi:hypothetical protein